MDYKSVNKQAWNERTDVHIASEFYNMEAFMNGQSSLKSIESTLLGDIKGKSILHLQCHFGQDTMSFSRMGAKATGVDLSDKAILRAKEIANQLDLDTRFIESDIYELPNHLDEQFDLVFTSYGTIGWLPDMDKWAAVVSKFLKPGGKFIFVEFHPVVWMFDDDFAKIGYNYFNAEPIVETNSGTYAQQDADIELSSVSWNHPISEVVNALIGQGLQLQQLDEFDYSPYDCFRHTEQVGEEKYRIKHIGDKIPMVYSLVATKNK